MHAYLDSTDSIRNSILLVGTSVDGEGTLEQPEHTEKSASPAYCNTKTENNSHSVSKLHLTDTLTECHNLSCAIAPRYSRPLGDHEANLLDQGVDRVQSRGVNFDDDLAWSGCGYGAGGDCEWGTRGGENEGGLSFGDGRRHCCFCWYRTGWMSWMNGVVDFGVLSAEGLLYTLLLLDMQYLKRPNYLDDFTAYEDTLEEPKICVSMTNAEDCD